MKLMEEKIQDALIKSFPVCRTIFCYIDAYALKNRSFEFYVMKTA